MGGCIQRQSRAAQFAGPAGSIELGSPHHSQSERESNDDPQQRTNCVYHLKSFGPRAGGADVIRMCLKPHEESVLRPYRVNSVKVLEPEVAQFSLLF
jgi:hypothetical protein